MIDLINQRNALEEVSLIAKVKDSYPRVWYPLVQSGYYYIDEQEYYLYSNRGYHISETTNPIKKIHNKLFVDGAPVLIEHNGVWLRKTQFIKKDNELSHIYEQTELGKGFDRIYFDFSTIDPETITLHINDELVSPVEYSFKG